MVVRHMHVKWSPHGGSPGHRSDAVSFYLTEVKTGEKIKSCVGEIAARAVGDRTHVSGCKLLIRVVGRAGTHKGSVSQVSRATFYD